MSETKDLEAAIAKPTIDLEAGRRAFLKTAGMGTALAAIAAVSSGEAQAAGSDYDVAILNFALNLEYLEAEFYQRAVYGVGLPDSYRTGRGQVGTVTGGSKVPFKSSVINDIAEIGRAHV